MEALDSGDHDIVKRILWELDALYETVRQHSSQMAKVARTCICFDIRRWSEGREGTVRTGHHRDQASGNGFDSASWPMLQVLGTAWDCGSWPLLPLHDGQRWDWAKLGGRELLQADRMSLDRFWPRRRRWSATAWG